MKTKTNPSGHPSSSKEKTEGSRPRGEKNYLLVSDFDQTLSFNDSGVVLSELLGQTDFHEKVAGMTHTHLVQQGAELSYLLLHDPEYRRVRREHLIETGKRIRLKYSIAKLNEILTQGIEGNPFLFYVVSAAPEDVVQSALEGIVPRERIFGTRLKYHPETGEIQSIVQATAGYGKVVVLDELQDRLGISPDRIVYVGDGSSDLHVMLHVNRRDGFTIAVSENPYIAPIAKRTVLSDNALSVLAPILEDLFEWDSAQIKELFATHGLEMRDWGKIRTDRLAFHGEEIPAALKTTLL